MSTSAPLPPALSSDVLQGFSIPARNVRGRIVRLAPVLDGILGAHDYPPAIQRLLAEALSLTALMGGLLKERDAQVTVQAQAEDGAIGLLVCDYREGELRGYVRHDQVRLAALAGGAMPLEALFGRGHLAITFDLAESGRRYQGVVPLEGASLAEAIEGYFERSEQIPTLIRTAVTETAAGHVAGAILLQHLPEGEEGRERLHLQEDRLDWDHVAILANSIRGEELTDTMTGLDTIVWRLFHEEDELRVQEPVALARGCRCSLEHFEQVLCRFPKEDRREMRNDAGIIVVDCAFCSREFEVQD